MPAYVLVLLYIAAALLFPDRWNYLLGLALALALYSGALGLGRITASNLLRSNDETIYFPLGLGLFLMLAYITAVISTGLILYALWIIAGTFAIFEIRRILFQKFSTKFLWGLPFLLLGFWSSFTPSIFFDTLVYHLGLPMQSVIIGKMETVPSHLFSTFPPFEFVLNLLFVKLTTLSGIKVFSILLAFNIIYVLVDLTSYLLKEESNQSIKGEFVVLPVIFLATIWIQVHLLTADLLVAMFLVIAISYMIKNRRMMDFRQIIAVAILASWAAWTKPTALPYLLLTASLWFPLKLVNLNFKKLTMLLGIIFLLICPIFIRNYAVTGDPLYPTLSKALKNPNWSYQQQLAWEADTAPRQMKMIQILTAPFEIIVKPFKYGSAAEIGIFYLLALSAYFFFWKKHPLSNRLLLFLALCYVAWSFLFRDFRQFFPVFLLIHVPCAMALQNLLLYRKWIPKVILIAAAIFSVHLVLPVFQGHIPLLRINQKQEAYLKENLDYYPFAEWTRSIQKTDKMLMLGETRIAYLNVPVMATTAFDKHPFFVWLSHASTPSDLKKQFAIFNIKYMMVNWQEYARFAEKCGLLPIDLVPPRFREVFKKGKARTGVPLAHLTKREMEILSEFSKSCLKPKWRMGDQYLVWEVRCKD